MVSTAKDILDKVSGASAVTLYGGYAMFNGKTVNFEPAHIAEEKRNKEGRCTKLVAQYKDGSELVFTWSQSSGAKYRVKSEGV